MLIVGHCRAAVVVARALCSCRCRVRSSSVVWRSPQSSWTNAQSVAISGRIKPAVYVQSICVCVRAFVGISSIIGCKMSEESITFLLTEDLFWWSLIAVSTLGYVGYYLREVVKRPILSVAEGPFSQFLRQNVPTLNQKFWPTFWCVESRAQTIVGSIIRSSILPAVNYEREIFRLDDGGEVALDWMRADCATDSPIVVILPGLTGSSQEEYVKGLVLSAKARGIRTVVFNNRGLGGMVLKTRRMYCASNYEDLSEIVRYVRRLHPHVKLGATGVSAGGMILGNYLARHSEEARRLLTASQIISSPFDLKKGVLSIEKPYVNTWLGNMLATGLCDVLRRCELFDNERERGGEYDMAKIMRSTTIKQFDTHFTAQNFGFANVDDYYTLASLHDKLHHVQVPLLCLFAADDPFQPLEAIPVTAASESTHVAIVVTARGGHIGFLEGSVPRAENQFMTRMFGEYFEAALRGDEFERVSAEMLANYTLAHASLVERCE